MATDRIFNPPQLVTIGLLWKVKKLPEPALVAIAAIIGFLAFPGVRQ